MRIPPTFPTAVFLVILVAGCASPPVVVAPPAGPTIPPASADTCGAATYATLVGRDYRQVPPAPAGRVFRVACNTCAITEDFNAQRLNVFYDDATGRITRLTCG